MPDRAAIKFHITAAPISNRCISSAYALSDFDSTISFGNRRQRYLSNTRQIRWTVIDSPDTETYCDDCGSQYFALDGRGIAVTALPILGTTAALKSIMDFNCVLLNMMALLLSVCETDRREEGIAVIEPNDFYFLIARLGE